MKLSPALIMSTVVAALGGLLFGFDTAVIAGTTAQLQDVFRLSDANLGLTVASALVGTILGAMLAGIPADRYGRRDTLRLMAVLYLVSALGCALAPTWYVLLAFRLIGGLGIGGSSVRAQCTLNLDRFRYMAWPDGRTVPVQRGGGYSARVSFELHRWADAVWGRGMALETGRPGDSGGAFSGDALPYSAQPPMACHEGRATRRRRYCA